MKNVNPLEVSGSKEYMTKEWRSTQEKGMFVRGVLVLCNVQISNDLFENEFWICSHPFCIVKKDI